jgi:hypothetical protein
MSALRAVSAIAPRMPGRRTIVFISLPHFHVPQDAG